MEEIQEALHRLAIAFEANNLSVPEVTIREYRDYSAMRHMAPKETVRTEYHKGICIAGVSVKFQP